jgi:hypothetical protein
VDRRTRNAFALILVVVIAVTGGAALILGGGPAAPGPPPDAPTVDGVVVAVDARSLTDVRSFDLRTADGRILTFGLGELQNGVAFPPGHLAEHKVSATPVRVWYRATTDPPAALYLEDAPSP